MRWGDASVESRGNRVGESRDRGEGRQHHHEGGRGSISRKFVELGMDKS